MCKSERAATRDWVDELTKQNSGEHYMVDFLHPEDLAKYMETHQVKLLGKIVRLGDWLGKIVRLGDWLGNIVRLGDWSGKIVRL